MSKIAPLIDSHCHLPSLDLAEFQQDMQCVLQEARSHGVVHFLSVCTEMADVAALYALADQEADISISVGIHPNTELAAEISPQQLVTLAEHPSCIAIGETGLDYYRTVDEAVREVQRARFCHHIQAALVCQKPLIIHTREAAEDTLKLMQHEHAKQIGGVMHCFAENWEIARQALDLNFYISFSGIVTFKNALQLQEVAKKVPLDRILIETDSPYLAPVPFRGKQNHPALVRYVAEALSVLRQVDYETIAQQTTENFYRCFRTEPRV